MRGGSEYMAHLFWPDDLDNHSDNLSRRLGVVVTGEKFGVTGDSIFMHLLDVFPTLQRRRYTRRELRSTGPIRLGEWFWWSVRYIHPSSAHPQRQLARGRCRSLLAGSYRDCTAWNSFLTSLGVSTTFGKSEKERMGMQMVWLPPGPQRDVQGHRFRAVVLREDWND